MEVTENTILALMAVTSLYANMPQEEGVTTVYNACERFCNKSSNLILTHF